MSDLFDEVAMRALGSRANLRPRPRTRFEPMFAPQITWSLDQAPSRDEPLPVEDDALAAGAWPPPPRPREAAPRTEPRGVGSGGSRLVVRPDIMPKPSAPGVERTIERTPDGQALGSLANTDGEIGVDTEPPRLPRASAQAPTAPIAQRPREPAPPSPIRAPPISTAPPTSAPTQLATMTPAPRLARPTPSISTPDRSRPEGLEPVVEAEAASLRFRAPAPDPLLLANGPPAVEGAPRPTPTPTPQGWKDPLGVQARASIERLSTTPEARESTPLAAAPIEVTIGRLEIRADSKPAPRAAKPFAPHVDLAAYRSRRDRQL
jgi:hypothetical protein